MFLRLFIEVNSFRTVPEKGSKASTRGALEAKKIVVLGGGHMRTALFRDLLCFH